MQNILKTLCFMAFLAVSGGVYAQQCVQPPQIIGQGFQGGAPCWGAVNQRVVIPQGIQPGMPFLTNIGGVNRRCTWQDRAATAVVDGVAGGLFAYGIGRLFRRDSANDWAAGGAAIGAAAGATVFCDPNAVNDGEQAVPQGAVLVNQSQQGRVVVVPGQQGRGGVPGYVPGTVAVQASCSILGDIPALQNIGVRDEQQCIDIRNRLTVTRQENPTTTQPLPPSAPKTSEPIITAEGTGSGPCRFLSNGTLRLKANPSQVLPRDTVVATENGSGGAHIPKQEGEVCSGWSRRVFQQLVWNG